MSHGKKPKGKHTLTLHFDTKVGVENFIAWYLDGGGEQDSGYYSKSWGKDWIHVQPDCDACPKCEHPEMETEELNNNTVKYKCCNCDFESEESL